MRVSGLPDTEANAAIDAAFKEIALVHERMTFRSLDSDVARLNREAAYRFVTVHPCTYQVLSWAQQIAGDSHGIFDITVARNLVEWGLLPRPSSSYWPDPQASWRDIELGPAGTVRFHRQVWIDLGGIAKGYAVDRAIACLRRHGAHRACVNAGGDLRVLGPGVERVCLRAGLRVVEPAAVVEIENGSLASSGGSLARRRHSGRFIGPHVDGHHGRPVGTHRFACVIAERCVIADALTKIILARGLRCDGLLRRYGATAHVHSARHGWRSAEACR
jgi:thiamine biosynthesis lipoprotein